jgi:hypothetical protein
MRRLSTLVSTLANGKLTYLGLCGAAALLAWGALTGAAAAEDVKYADLFRTHAMKCLHPTVNAANATIETLKGPEKAGDVTTVRLKAYYQGLIKKGVMEAELMIRQAGSIRQMKVNVLADSAAHKPCELEKNWKDF